MALARAHPPTLLHCSRAYSMCRCAAPLALTAIRRCDTLSSRRCKRWSVWGSWPGYGWRRLEGNFGSSLISERTRHWAECAVERWRGTGRVSDRRGGCTFVRKHWNVLLSIYCYRFYCVLIDRRVIFISSLKLFQLDFFPSVNNGTPSRKGSTFCWHAMCCSFPPLYRTHRLICLLAFWSILIGPRSSSLRVVRPASQWALSLPLGRFGLWTLPLGLCMLNKGRDSKELDMIGTLIIWFSPWNNVQTNLNKELFLS